MEFMCILTLASFSGFCISTTSLFYYFQYANVEGEGLGELVKYGNVNVMQCQYT